MSSSPAVPAQVDKKSVRILIVEDDDRDQELIRHFLAAAGYRTIQFCTTGEVGIQRAVEWKPEIVVCDTILPGMDGFAVCQRLSLHPLVEAKLIMMTGQVDAVDATRAREMGASDYVVKTTDFDTLIDSIKSIRHCAGHSHLEGLHVLIVDDDVNTQNLMKALTREWGLIVEVASDGSEAVTKIEEKDFDICFMDLKMPVMDGYEASKKIREGLKKTLPIVALTASRFEEGLQKSLESGMNDYITKPIIAEEIERTIAKWVETRKTGP